MLLKCVAKGRCCPKPEEELEHDPAQHAAMHMYCNPFADAAPISSLMSFSGLDSHEFPPGSGALMYSPPTDIEDSDSDKEKGCDGGDELDEVATIGAVEKIPANVVVAQQPVGVLGPGGGYPSHRAPGNVKMQQGQMPFQHGGQHSVIVPVGVRKGKPMAPQSAAVPLTSPHKTSSRPTSGPSSPATEFRQSPVQEFRKTSPVQEYRQSPVQEFRQSPASEFRQLQPRRLDTTPRSDPYSNDVGAQSIEVLGKCVARAKCLPSEKQPNSEKWTGRWERTNINLTNKR